MVKLTTECHHGLVKMMSIERTKLAKVGVSQKLRLMKSLKCMMSVMHVFVVCLVILDTMGLQANGDKVTPWIVSIISEQI